MCIADAILSWNAETIQIQWVPKAQCPQSQGHDKEERTHDENKRVRKPLSSPIHKACKLLGSRSQRKIRETLCNPSLDATSASNQTGIAHARRLTRVRQLLELARITLGSIGIEEHNRKAMRQLFTHGVARTGAMHSDLCRASH